MGAPDLYHLLGVSREATREEIAAAWRRRARAEHPDARPADADAPGRFRALAQAWQVLGDPARRAAYDRDMARGRPAAAPSPAGAVRVPVRHLRGQGDPPLRAGPVRVASSGPAAAPLAEQEVVLAIWAEVAAWYLRGGRGRQW